MGLRCNRPDRIAYGDPTALGRWAEIKKTPPKTEGVSSSTECQLARILLFSPEGSLPRPHPQPAPEWRVLQHERQPQL